MFYKVNVTDGTLIEAAPVLPSELQGLAAVSLADLSWVDPALGYTGKGFWPVVTTTPAYDAATEIPSGEYDYEIDVPNQSVNATAVIRDLTEGELEAIFESARAAKKAAVDAKLYTVMTGGYTHDFGAPHGTKVLQTRDVEDRTNWLTSQAAYLAAVMAGAGAVEEATFRSADNSTITVSYQDGLAALLGMAAWGKSVYGNSWALKDAIAAATTQTELDAIDINTGWPS